MEVGAKSPPEIIIFDGDGEEIHRQGVRDTASVEDAMKRGMDKYVPREIDWEEYSPERLIEARESESLVVIAFSDGKKSSVYNLEALENRSLVKLHDQITFLKVDFVRKGHVETEWKVGSAPTILVVDPRKDPGYKAIISKLQGKKSWRSFKKSFEKGLRVLAKELK